MFRSNFDYGFKMIDCLHRYQVESRLVTGAVVERSSHSGDVTNDALLEREGGVVEHSVAVV